MPNISNDSLVKGSRLPDVEVLLATLNAEKHIEEFLLSLSKQEGVKIHLRVSDDGSSDHTLRIVDTYRQRFESCEILEGPRSGPASNFFHLINHATKDFVAIADQDDIWLPNHLHDSIIRLKNTEEMPSLTFSSVIEFEDSSNELRLWPTRFPDKDIRSILTENLARGCTFVLNSKAINLINLYKPKSAIMHDWWILLLIASTGNVTWSHSPEIRYRIHENNLIGRTPRIKERIFRFFKTYIDGRWMVIDQISELLRHYGQYMQPESRDILSMFLFQFNSRNKIEKMKLCTWTGHYRSTFIDEIAVRMVLLTRKTIYLEGERGYRASNVRAEMKKFSESFLAGELPKKSYSEREFLKDPCRVLAFYLPQYHQISENSEWWSPGFTDWVNVAKSRPLFDEHYQPHIPRELGFYDLTNVQNIQEQVNLAVRFGINGFCFYFYWFDGKRILEKPLDLFMESTIDFPIALCWANETWSRTWDGNPTDILIEQVYSENFHEDLVNDLESYFVDPRYIKIEGRPLFIIYRAMSIPDSRNAIMKIRTAIREKLNVDPYIAIVDFYDVSDLDSLGADALIEFPPHKFWSKLTKLEPYPKISNDFQGAVIDYEKVILQSLKRNSEEIEKNNVLRGLVPGWDNTPRKGLHSVILHGSSPDLFKNWLQALRESTRERAINEDEKLIFVNAWNEWAEGAHLEPDLKFGLRYLNSVKSSEYFERGVRYRVDLLNKLSSSKKSKLPPFEMAFESSYYNPSLTLLRRLSRLIFKFSPRLHVFASRIYSLIYRLLKWL